MAARRVRRTFATPFVITVATSSCSKGEPPKPPLRMYQVTNEGGGVYVVEDTCPKGVDCKVTEPFAYLDAPYRMREGEHRHPTRAETYLYGELDGHCYIRPFGCSTRECLGKEVRCIERPTTPVPTQAWSVKAEGGTCKVTPERTSSIAPAIATYSMPCPKGLDEDGAYRARVNRDVDAASPCEAREDFDCEPGATCNPPAPTAIACPPK
jgi:hypothetical protein